MLRQDNSSLWSEPNSIWRRNNSDMIRVFPRLVTRAPLCPTNLLLHLICWPQSETPLRGSSLVFINLFIIQFKWNAATAEAGTITSRGRTMRGMKTKWIFSLLLFNDVFAFYFNPRSMMQCYGCPCFQFSILVMSSWTMCYFRPTYSDTK